MPIPQTAYDEVERLIIKFKALPKRERDAYNEDNTRKDFVLPLSQRALLWNTDDSREVAAEEKISRGFVDFSIRINFDDPADKKQHDAIVAHVNEMLELQKEFAEAERHKEDRRHALKTRIDEVDAAIDAAVYRLYELSAEEIKIVERKEKEK